MGTIAVRNRGGNEMVRADGCEALRGRSSGIGTGAAGAGARYGAGAANWGSRHVGRVGSRRADRISSRGKGDCVGSRGRMTGSTGFPGTDTGMLRQGPAVLQTGRMKTNNTPENTPGKTPDTTPDKKPRRTPKRRTGGQPGNTNARKHGFYSTYLTPKERRKLKEASRLEGLENELSIMRYKVNRMTEDPNVSALQFGRAVDMLARVAKVQRKYFAPTEDDRIAIMAGLVNSFGAAIGLGKFVDGVAGDDGGAGDG